MKILSFGGFIKNEDVPVPQRQRTGEASIQATAIMEHLAKLPDGNTLPITIENFGPYERYALQTRLQGRGAKVVCRVTGERKKIKNSEGKDVWLITKGTLFISKLTPDQWRQYMAQPGNTGKKK